MALDQASVNTPRARGGSSGPRRTGRRRLLCTDPEYPSPLHDVTLQAQVDEDIYLFVVTFEGPDGQVAEWPLCTGVPLSKYCYRRDAMFEYYIRRQPDGGYRIIGGLPPAIDLRSVNEGGGWGRGRGDQRSAVSNWQLAISS